MALEYDGHRIGAMQYNGVTIGEAMMDGQVVYQSWDPYDWSTTFAGVSLHRTAWTVGTSHTATTDPRQAQIEFTVDWVNLAYGDSSSGIRVLVNGTVVAESRGGGGSLELPDPISTSVNLTAGDVVRFEGRGPDVFSSTSRIVEGSASITSIT